MIDGSGVCEEIMAGDFVVVEVVVVVVEGMRGVMEVASGEIIVLMSCSVDLILALGGRADKRVAGGARIIVEEEDLGLIIEVAPPRDIVVDLGCLLSSV